MTKVSIIIPLHNSNDYIVDTVKSCLNQTYKDIEIVIVENGSTDGSLTTVYQIQSDLIKIYSIGKASSTIARNYGLRKATGSYIQYLDADDILSPNKIESQLHLLKQHDDHTIISCGWGKFKNTISDAEFIAQKVWADYETPINWLLDAWDNGGMMQTACWFAHKEIIEGAGSWNEDLKQNPNDDGEFFCRVILKANRIIFDPSCAVYYRLPKNNNVSQNKSEIAISSLLGSYLSYQNVIFKVEQSKRVKVALGHNYLSFIYQYNNLYPHLTLKAENYFYNLNIGKMWAVGGKKFKTLAGFIGFKNALRIKNLKIKTY